MNNFGTLCGYELRKILRKRIVWITMAIMLVLITVSISSQLWGNYYVDNVKIDSNYHMFQTDAAYQKALNGRKIDQTLLEETFAGYGKIPHNVEKYSATEEYRRYARPYSAIFSFVRDAANMKVAQALEWKPSEQQLYEMRQQVLEQSWQNYELSEAEKEYWREKETKLETPFVFVYKEGYWTMHYMFQTMGIFTLLSVAICLANVFPEEHTRRTDQLLLSGRNGKKLYGAKLLAGTGFAVGQSVFYTAFAMMLCFALYGADGFEAAFQLIYPGVSYPLSVGAAMLISYGMLIAAAMLTGIFVLVFSEICRNSMGTLAVASGLILLSMFINIPENNRVLSQIWGCFPSVLLATWELFDVRLIPVFGSFLTKWQFAPILYLTLSGLFIIPGKYAYIRQK